MKILHSYKVYRPDIDGGIPFVIAALSRLVDNDVTNGILVARRVGKARRYVIDDVPVEALSSLGTIFSTPIAPAFPLVLLRRSSAVDIVVHHAPFPLADMVSSFLPDDVALIVYWHADIVGHSWLKTLMTPVIKRTLRRANRIVVSDRTIVDNSPLLSPFADKCVVVPYGVDVDFWNTPSAMERNTALRLRDQYPRMVLTIGRLVPYKGLDVLLRAMQELDAQLIIIGEGPLEMDLKRTASDTGLTARVTFAGRLARSDMKTYLHAARVLAFPSVTSAEAFGIVQLEAMAAGLPIVNTALTTAVPHIARHEKESLTVPHHDSHALAAAIRRILDEPTLAGRLGEAGHLRARTEYSNDRFLSRMKVVYDEVTQSCQRNRSNTVG
ncbi:glycosyl transferase, group 1 [Nitrobacter hamburgensis X14]|uniref:Glycosyl transferase, group 1 n=1 Tax=Nitrobacter hamburgensis (strain DSM 10229 / NCIMB 13809 / X14) TaxID=323097 RepID=Q1QJP3_NITHX|nr:glycosyl transferase, group 1 [Nitrobacter hamburgensis X14]